MRVFINQKLLTMKIFVIGDIHGNYLGLMQCLERSKFDYQNDTLISLGDVVDGHSQSFEVVSELLKIKKLIPVKGNHDDWFNTWIRTGFNPSSWQQGQKATGLSYLENSRPGSPWFKTREDLSGWDINIQVYDIPENHKKFFERQLSYYIDDDRNLFIHGGFNRHYSLNEQDEDIFWWDRDLWGQALSYESMIIPTGFSYKPSFKMVEEFKEIFIGHTSTQFWGLDQPMHAANIWNIDTGGGWMGRVTIMDVSTKEYFQSDLGNELYPDFKGRN